MTFLTATPSLFQQARVILVGSGRMGHIRAKAIFANPRFELVGVVDENVENANRLADVYRVSCLLVDLFDGLLCCGHRLFLLYELFI